MPTTMAVIKSVAVFCALIAITFAGTVPNRAGLPVQSSHILPPKGSDKSSDRRIMNSAFANAGKTPGLQIWRIENFQPVAYPKNNFGKFYNGDSYIVLNTVEKKDKTLSWDVHFWLGAETSIDEAGAAAILTVQLDDLLNGVPVQHREVQDHESQLFLSYFKNGVRYEQGGVGTGFKHVETNAAGEKRLFQVKGKRNVRVRQVNPSISSMNKGDCFILDAGNTIYVYVGEKAKRVEKLKAISAANQIRDQDHNGRATVSIIDEFSSTADKEQFFSILGSGSASAVPEESTSEDDAAFERTEESATTLYRVSDAGGKLKIEQISTKPLRQEMLDTKDCFILDTGSGIYVWVGRGATQKEKSDSMLKAQEFLRTKKYPAWTQIHRIVEGAESAPFKQYFATWRDVGMTHTRLVRSALGYDTDDSEFDVDDVDAVIKNLKKSGGSAIGFMPDNGQNEIEEVTQYISRPGTHEIMRLTVEYDEKLPILGFAAYIVPYSYTTKKGESGKIIYVWEGVKATQGAKNKCFEEAMEMAVAENAILVRTVQNHEARHFLKIFKGNLMTPYTAAPVRPQLFRIRGTDVTDVHASEVVCDSASLASTDVFALLTSKDHKIYIWVGLAASDFEKEMATKRFGNYWPDAVVEVIEEGAEPDDFWDDLQGEGQYDRSLLENERPLLEPRLFHCRLVGKYGIQVEEVGNFEQEDLDTEDIMLVDAGDEIYMWVGSGANSEENSRILDMAKKYIKMEPTNRSIDTLSVIRVTQGSEPRAFKRMFPVWEDNHWQNQPSYAEAKKLLIEHFPRDEDNDV